MLKIIKAKWNESTLNEVEPELKIIIHNKSTWRYCLKNNIDLKQYAFADIKAIKKEKEIQNIISTNYAYLDNKILFQSNTNFLKVTIVNPTNHGEKADIITLDKTFYSYYENNPSYEYINSLLQELSEAMSRIDNKNAPDYLALVKTMKEIRTMFTGNVRTLLKTVENLQLRALRINLLPHYSSNDIEFEKTYLDAYYTNAISSIEKIENDVAAIKNRFRLIHDHVSASIEKFENNEEFLNSDEKTKISTNKKFSTLKNIILMLIEMFLETHILSLSKTFKDITISHYEKAKKH